MGHNANVKLLRKQVRNVAQQHYQSAMTSEAITDLDKRFTEHAGKRLDQIAENVTNEVKKIDGQTREFRRLLMQDASGQISRELFEINVTLLAWQAVLLKELGMNDIAEFEGKVKEKKKELTDKLEAEAKAADDARRAAQAEEDAKAKAAQDAATVAPDTQQVAPQSSDAAGPHTAASESPSSTADTAGGSES